MANGPVTWKGYVRAHRTALVFAGLWIVGLLIYAPILPGNFLSDDHTYIAQLLEYGRQYVQGESLDDWFFGYTSPSFVRPLVQWLWLDDYVIWHTFAAGYYLTNISLHVLNSFLVYLLISQVVNNRFGALAGAILFMLHPSHPDSVAWISDRTDVLATFFGLGSAVFFLVYRRRHRLLFLFVSVAAFALAALTKENAITLPGVFLAYDLLFTLRQHGWRTIWAEAVFWLMLPAYVAVRWLMLGGFLGKGPLGVQQAGMDQFLQFYVEALGKPFLPDMNGPLIRIVLIGLVILLVVFRNNRGLWMGLAWLVSALVPAVAPYMAARLVYLPSVGLAIAEGAVVTQLARGKPTRALAAMLFLVLAAAYLFALFPRVSDYVNAGSVTAAIPRELRQLHSSFPKNAALFFVGIPITLRNVDLYTGVFPFAIRNAYPGNPYFSAFAGDKFPILSHDVDRAYFFEYRRRTIVEHPEVQSALLARENCLSHSYPAYAWEFPKDMEQWEPWNELTDFEAGEGTLVTRALGGDPFMGSPPLDIPSLALGDVELDMRIQADTPDLHGSVFWRVQGMEDFSPALQATFDVKADGEFHRYLIDLSETGQLAMGDHIVQLRLDPVDAPSYIEIQSVRLYSHCESLTEDKCQCGL